MSSPANISLAHLQAFSVHRSTEARGSTKMIALALLMTCILSLGCSENRALAQVKLYNDTLLTKDMVAITVNDGQSEWRFGPSALHLYVGAWAIPELETRNKGTMIVTYQFRDPDGAVISEGQVMVGLRRDWLWGIDIFHTGRNPYRGCMGCFGYRSFPILDPAYMASDSDSVFVIWGGNSIRNPVEY
jgi:hypothetical protein